MQILVVDIGGTFIKYACMTEDMSVLSRGKVKTPESGREELIETIGNIYDQMPEVEGIAISMPGIIDSENGYCSMGGALRYNDDFYLRHSLYQRCPVKIIMENDAKCAAMAEAAVGNLKDVEDGFVLIFGTMIGGGFIKNHTLHRGKHFSAGEVSYINTGRDSMPTFSNLWGNRCSTVGLCKMYAEKKKLDPERFAIGGGISAQPVFIEYIRNNLKELYAECPYHVPHAEVVSCKFQNDANLVGTLQCFLACA